MQGLSFIDNDSTYFSTHFSENRTSLRSSIAFHSSTILMNLRGNSALYIEFTKGIYFFIRRKKMEKLIPHISTIEIPVQSIQVSIEWYKTILKLEVTYQGEHDAMLRFQSSDLPKLYLVETDSSERLGFINSRTQIKHSVVDFYTPNLKELYDHLVSQNVRVTELNLNGEFGGFGFYDIDNNLFSACNIL
jgi:hypothetical protein